MIYKKFKHTLKDNVNQALVDTIKKSLKPYLTLFVNKGILTLEFMLDKTNTSAYVSLFVQDHKDGNCWKEITHPQWKIKDGDQILDKELYELTEDLRKFVLHNRQYLFYNRSTIVIDFLEV